MIKSNNKLSKHIGKSKGKFLAEILKSCNLNNTMIVPIEIGKNFHKALIADYFGSIFKEPFEFHSSQEGTKFLHNSISSISKKYHTENVILAMEASGHYYKLPARSLHQLGYNNLFILNPISTAQCRKAGLTWAKTDNEDLRAIGQALLSGYATVFRPEKQIWNNLREICRYRRFQVKLMSALKNKIHVFLDNLLPGITQIQMFKDQNLWHTAAMEFFAKYPNLELVSRLKPNNIINFFQRRGRRISPEDAYQLIHWTKQSFNPDSPANPTREFILNSLLLQLRQLFENISQIEIEILGFLVQIPAALLLTIDYIGPIRAAEFAGEITPFEQYPNSRALIKYAGLDSTRFQSASRESDKHPISKKGSVPLRYITVDIADALMKNNDYFSFFANRLIQRGKSNDCACIATATRFMRVAFWMIKDLKAFQPHNSLGISKDPLAKIERFLRQRKASEKINEYINLSKNYFQ